MHELSVMSEVIRSVLSEAARRNAVSIKKVVLEVGELTFLGTDQLSFGFEALKGDGLLKNAELEIGEKKAEIECSCGYRGGMEYSETPGFHQLFPVVKCPDCGGMPRVVAGKDCMVRNIIMEIDDVQVQEQGHGREDSGKAP